jgi:hypothetical protein
MLEAPRLPLLVRTANALARPFARALPQLSLAPERLLAEAVRRSGLSDFGDDDAWRSGLARFCASAEAEAALTPLGRSIARNSLLGALENRLRMTDWRRRHPEIDAERIERPVIVIGMGRTGTTILHDLLARDPAIGCRSPGRSSALPAAERSRIRRPPHRAATRAWRAPMR